MNNDLAEFLLGEESAFSAELGKSGGYIQFSNSDRRGAAKSFHISLEALYVTLRDIQSNLSEFSKIQIYDEAQWRKKGAKYFSNPVANSIIMVQTKPLFSTLSKLIKWSNLSVYQGLRTEQQIVLNKETLAATLSNLSTVISSYTPIQTIKEVPPLQAIYYGAPGTGKSYKIKGLTKGETIRTTFHPDSDYSTFVGAYKPTMEEVQRPESSGPQVKEKRIVYSFVPQAFLKAYVQAWAKYPAPQYLVIEEINRGNCAQIFGDLFQLLDRNGAGFSEYPIMADTDICRYLRDEFSNGNFGPNKGQRDDIDAYYRGEYESVVEDVQAGKLLLLPCNLHILATMNTSDQSLFPIDSAFKRRWTWEYIPIRNAGRGWVIRADGRAWDWWSFLERINEEIGNATESEDKKLGYYFVRPTDDRTIAAETFVGKVLFYLWNDVIKNYGFNGDVLQAGDKEKLMTFPMFYETEREGQQVNEALVAQFLSNLQVAQLPSADEHGEKGSSDEGMQEA